MVQYLGPGLTNGAGVDAFSAGGPGMQFGPRTAYTATGTKTVATETNWVPPSGMTLWGFRVIAVGAGGGAFTGNGGGGGNRVERTISYEAMGSPSTVAITVGAGSNNADGGTTSFGTFVLGHGGKVGGISAHPDELLGEAWPEGMPGEAFATGNAKNGASSPRGLRGGGGCSNDGSWGGRARPFVSATAVRTVSGGAGVPSALTYFQPPYRHSSNQTPQNGVEDWPGDGGNNNQDGYFPGGGAGGDTANTTQRRGGHGTCIVYAIFRKT